MPTTSSSTTSSSTYTTTLDAVGTLGGGGGGGGVVSGGMCASAAAPLFASQPPLSTRSFTAQRPLSANRRSSQLLLRSCPALPTADPGSSPGSRACRYATWQPSAPWDASPRVPAELAIGAGGPDGLSGGFRWGGGYEDDRHATLERAAMPPPSSEARLLASDANDPSATLLAGASGTVRAHVQRPVFAPHGEPNALRPLHCLACEPTVGGANSVLQLDGTPLQHPAAAPNVGGPSGGAREGARVLAGAMDGFVVEAQAGRLITTAWKAHEGVVSALAYAGTGRCALAASVGEDG